MERFTVCPAIHAMRSPALLSMVALLALLPAGAGAADSGRNGREVARDRVEVRQDRGELAGDISDVRQLEEMVRHMDEAHARGDGLAESRYRREVRAFLQRKSTEERRDVAMDRRDLRRSGRELRADRREVTQDRRDRRDDRQDRRADARDLARSENRLEHEREILAELRGLEPAIRRGDARAEARERQLLGDFLALTKQDARSAARETRQDRRELRQDRRERRQELEQGGGTR